MIVSLIENTEYIYLNLHAEEVISSNYLKDGNEGIYITSLQFKTINRLYDFIKTKTFLSKKNIVLDFNNFEHVQENMLDKITEIRDLGYKLVLLNVHEKIIKSLSLKSIENENNILNDEDGYNIFYFFSDKESKLYKIDFNSGKIFYAQFKKRIKNCN